MAKLQALVVIMAVTLVGCAHTMVIEDAQNVVVQGRTFQNVRGDGLEIINSKNITVENCTFRHIKGDAIHIMGESDGITIQDNEIYDTDMNGILASESSRNLKIINNKIHDIGYDPFNVAVGFHPIYCQVPDALIEGNIIYNVRDDGADGITVRSSAIIRNNRVEHTTKHCISYYSDHPGYGGLLLIENNDLSDCTYGIWFGIGGSELIGSAIVRDNTINSRSSDIKVSEGFEGVNIGWE